MIGFLRGLVVHKQPPILMLDVKGVGYELQAPMSTFYALTDQEQPVTLYTHLAVRDDAHVLYAFAALAERTLFRHLIKINGVGGKIALAILSSMTADEFSRAIQQGDLTALTRVPGIGKRTAERLMIEMRDRVKEAVEADNTNNTTSPGIPAAASPLDDALDALLALGYKQAEALKMLKTVEHDGLPTEEIIRHALKRVHT